MIDVMESGDQNGEMLPGLYWGVRASFVDYVAGSADGDIYGDDGVETDGSGTFRFPVRDAQRTASGWTIDFDGELRFLAHFGALNVGIVRPRVVLDEESDLSVEQANGVRIRIARVQSREPQRLDEWLVWPPLDAVLTAEGSAIFGDVYGENAALDRLRIAIAFPSGDAPTGS